MTFLVYGSLAGIAIGVLWAVISLRRYWTERETLDPFYSQVFATGLRFVFGAIGWGFTVGILGLIVGFATASLTGNLEKVQKQVSVLKRYQLVALNTDSFTRGTFFLGSGYVEGHPVYVFFYVADGGVRRGQIDATLDIVIKEEDRTDGELLQYTCNFDRPKDAPRQRLYVGAYCPEEHRYEFHIPRGSIIHNYRVN